MNGYLPKEDFEILKNRMMNFRSSQLSNSTYNEEERSIETIIATEQPCIMIDWERSDWSNYELMREILLCEPSSVEFPDNRQVPFLDSHMRWGGVDAVKGSIRNLKVNNNRVEGKTFIDETESNLLSKIRNKHITNTSAGYSTYEDKTIRLKMGEKKTIKGREFENDYKDGLDLVIRTKWSLNEGSAVIWGADSDSKFRNSVAADIEKLINEKMKDIETKITNNQREKKMPPIELSDEQKTALQKETNDKVEAAVFAENQRCLAIDKLAIDFQQNLPGIKLQEEAAKFKNDRTKSASQFQTFILDKMKDPEAVRPANNRVGLTNKEIQDYSIRKIILYQLGKLEAREVGMELEASEALKKALNIQSRGVILPEEILRRRRAIRLGNLSQGERDLLAGTDASGKYLVKDQYVGGLLEYLENAMVMKAAGCTVITGVTGNIPMNRELDAYTTYYAAEGSGPSKSSITFGQETVTPHKGGALAQYSYEFLMQQTMAVEAYVEMRLATALALQLDKAGVYGSGAASQPKGLKLWTGVGSVLGAGFTRDTALSMEAQIETANATTLGSMKFLSKGSTRSTLRGKPAASNQSLGFLVGGTSENNSLIGYDYSLVSNQFTAGDLALGIWPELMYFIWNQMEILANPFEATAFPAGDVQVRALQAFDVFVRNPAAFSFATGVN